jgi:hypothetical protein
MHACVHDCVLVYVSYICIFVSMWLWLGMCFICICISLLVYTDLCMWISVGLYFCHLCRPRVLCAHCFCEFVQFLLGDCKHVYANIREYMSRHVCTFVCVCVGLWKYFCAFARCVQVWVCFPMSLHEYSFVCLNLYEDVLMWLCFHVCMCGHMRVHVCACVAYFAGQCFLVVCVSVHVTLWDFASVSFWMCIYVCMIVYTCIWVCVGASVITVVCLCAPICMWKCAHLSSFMLMYTHVFVFYLCEIVCGCL